MIAYRLRYICQMCGKKIQINHPFILVDDDVQSFTAKLIKNHHAQAPDGTWLHDSFPHMHDDGSCGIARLFGLVPEER